jgi:glycosyltransferase involved in cell wall biosynthesis
MLMLHRALGTWQQRVARHLALSASARAKFIEAGLPAERITVKPNFVDAPPPPEDVSRAGFLFVGRLAPEKGLSTLAAAWRGRAGTLRVAGTGADGARLDDLDGVTRLGAIDPALVRHEMLRARALVLPSICHEGFPRVLVEAMAAGLPVIASRLGALAELVDDGRTGLLFEAGDAADLRRALDWADAHPAELARMGAEARRTYEARYTPAHALAALEAVYAEVTAAAAAPRAGR